jgi:hypothetical protein
MWAIYLIFGFSITNMPKIILGIENKSFEILVIKYDGQEIFPPLNTYSMWSQEIDNEKTIEIIRQNKPGDSKLYKKGFFGQRCRVECNVDGDALRVRENWGQ